MLGALQLRVDLDDNKKYTEKSLKYLPVETCIYIFLLKLKLYLFYVEDYDRRATKLMNEIGALLDSGCKTDFDSFPATLEQDITLAAAT